MSLSKQFAPDKIENEAVNLVNGFIHKLEKESDTFIPESIIVLIISFYYIPDLFAVTLIGIIIQNKYRIQGDTRIGEFRNSKIYKIQPSDTSKLYQCKIIKNTELNSSTFHQQRLLSEINIHQTLKHENIVEFGTYFQSTKNVYIFTETCDNACLLSLLVQRRKVIESEVSYFMKQILMGVQYLHSMFIIHRNLKLGIYAHPILRIKSPNLLMFNTKRQYFVD